MRLIGSNRYTVMAICALALLMVALIRPRASAEDIPMKILSEASSEPLRCAIRQIDHGDTVELRGVLTATAPVSGHFRFAMVKSGPSGTSNVNQANPFKLTPGLEMQVARVTINRDGGSHVTIDFTASAEDGRECHAEARL